jgi:hypothetical protein
MAKLPDPIITIKLEPEVMDLIRDLRSTVDLYVAHTENLIERVRVLEEGQNWEFLAQCHDCTITAIFSGPDQANWWCEEHATTRNEKSSRMFHAAYVTPIVKRP